MKTIGRILIILAVFALVMGITFVIVNAPQLFQFGRSPVV